MKERWDDNFVFPFFYCIFAPKGNVTMQQLELEFLYEHPLYKDYACDKDGNVYSLKDGKIRKLKPSMNKYGYLQFVICKDGKRVVYPRVNRFVWECIKGEIPTDYHVDHLDFNRLNNSIDNLLARPARENRVRKSEEGRRRIGEAVKKANSKPVIQLDMQNNPIAEFPSAKEASRQTGISQGSISNCCNGKRKNAGGKIWKYNIN